MRFAGHDDHDPNDRDRDEAAESPPIEIPLDAAESTWDPWLWALYLRELAEKRPPTLH
jgi:hypothetical protein